MSALMTIDQAGLPAGTPGQARIDGQDGGQLVTLTSNAHVSTFRFELLWVGQHPSPDTNSVATLAAATATTWTFTPTSGVYGTWAIRLITDEGTADEDVETRIFAIVEAGKQRIPAPGEQGDPTASLVNDGAEVVARSWNNVPEGSGPFAAGTWAPWWRALADVIHGGGGSGSGGGSDFVLDSGAAAGGNVYNTWGAAIAAMNAVPGRKRLFIAQGESTQTGTYDLGLIELHGLGGADGLAIAFTVVDGCFFSELPPVVSNLQLTYQGTTAPLFAPPTAEGFRERRVYFENAIVLSTGGQYVVSTESGSRLALYLRGFFASGEFFDISGTGDLTVIATEVSDLSSAVYAYTGSGQLTFVGADNTTGLAALRAVFSNGQFITADGLTNAVAAAGATTAFFAQPNNIGAESTAAGTTVTLPDAATLDAGQAQVVHDVSGQARTNPITVDVDGGGTINGAASIRLTEDFQAVLLVPAADGSNAYRVAGRSPSYDATHVFVVDGTGDLPYTYATFDQAYQASLLVPGRRRIHLLQSATLTSGAYDFTDVELTADFEAFLTLEFNGTSTWSEPPALVDGLSLGCTGRSSGEVWDVSVSVAKRLELKDTYFYADSFGFDDEFINARSGLYTFVLVLRGQSEVGKSGRAPITGSTTTRVDVHDSAVWNTDAATGTATLLVNRYGGALVEAQGAWSGAQELTNAVSEWIPGYSRDTTGAGNASPFIGETVIIAGTGGTIQLPPTSGRLGDRVAVVDRAGLLGPASAVTVAPDGAELINGKGSFTLDSQWGAWEFVYASASGWVARELGLNPRPGVFVVDPAGPDHPAAQRFITTAGFFAGAVDYAGEKTLLIAGDVSDTASRFWNEVVTRGLGIGGSDPVLTFGAGSQWSAAPLGMENLRVNFLETVFSIGGGSVAIQENVFRGCEFRMDAAAASAAFVAGGGNFEIHLHECDIDGNGAGYQLMEVQAGNTLTVHLHGKCTVGPDTFVDDGTGSIRVYVHDPRTDYSVQNAVLNDIVVAAPDREYVSVTGNQFVPLGRFASVDTVTAGANVTITITDPALGDDEWLGNTLFVADQANNFATFSCTINPPAGWGIRGNNTLNSNGQTAMVVADPVNQLMHVLASA